MSDKRKQLRRDIGLRSQFAEAAQFLSPAEANLLREVDYIRRLAAQYEARIVSLGDFTFFSTQTGDAWMLDADDKLAVCLARDGVSQPARIVETENTAAVEWDCTYSIENDQFTTIDKSTGRVSNIIGYPTRAILTAIRNANETKS